jgi:hypothetical protein
MDKKQAYEELSFIKKMMTDSQLTLIDNGKIVIGWSLLALLGIALKIFKDFLDFKFNNLFIYIPIIAVGWVFAIFYKRRAYLKTGGRTYATIIMDSVGMAFGISICILGIVGYISGGIRPMAVTAVVAVLFGFNQYLSGVLSNRRWFTILAYGWWISSIVMFFWSSEYSVILVGILVILFQLIPGIRLYQNWKKQRYA